MASPPSRRISGLSSAVNYPFPSEVHVANFVPLKLGPSNYLEWKLLILNFIEIHRLVGFVDGTIQPPPLLSPEAEEEEQSQEEYRSWKRSDGLVRGWILVTVTEEILLKMVGLKTARNVWVALEQMLIFSPPESIDKPERATMAQRYLPLHKAALRGDWENATKFLKQEPDGVRDKITLYSETALMLVVRSSKRNHFVKKLMEMMSPEEVALKDVWGETALHKAALCCNNVAAKWLVEKNPELANILTEDGRLAVHMAAERGNREMVIYLLEVTKMGGDPNPFEEEIGLNLLNDLAFGGFYDIALTFLQRYPKLASMRPSPLLLMGRQRSSFRSGMHLNFFQYLVYSGIPLKLEGNGNIPPGRDIENSVEGVVSPLGYLSQKLNAMFWDVAETLVPPIKSVREIKLIHHQALKFVKHLCEEVVKFDFSKGNGIFRSPLENAASLGTCEIVEEILESFPSGIYIRNEKNQFIFHVAIENRQENVFNLIYQLEQDQNGFLSVLDTSRNNALHIAANFASRQQLSLRANVAGAALQMQRELQWFKEVEKFSAPQEKYRENDEGKTPQDVFTEKHKDLVQEGEKWMKDTASSCTIVASLVLTIVFAAAITVPGGINGDNGLPIFLEDRVFVLFGISDALALFSSASSLLMFLSILTSRYGEQDFLYSLPKKLIIGLVTLFLSIISMMIAFGATLEIVFGSKREWILIPVVLLSCVPVTLFALLQFPLLLHMIQSTYYPGIFRKRSNRIFY